MNRIKTEIHDRGSGDAWVMFCGYTDRDRFPHLTQMHTRRTTIYPRKRRRFQPWQPWDANSVCDAVSEAIDSLSYQPERIIWAGNSDGCEDMHHYAVVMLDRWTRYRPSLLVHYAGRFLGAVADVPCLCYLGEDDPIERIRLGTHRTAEEYGVEVIDVRGGHRWDARNNDRILSDAAASVDLTPTPKVI